MSVEGVDHNPVTEANVLDQKMPLPVGGECGNGEEERETREPMEKMFSDGEDVIITKIQDAHNNNTDYSKISYLLKETNRDAQQSNKSTPAAQQSNKSLPTDEGNLAYNEKTETQKDEGTGNISKWGGSVGLFVLDNLISALIVGPLNVCFWRGVWEPMERDFIPNSLILHGFVCFILGNAGILTACYCQTLFTKIGAPNNVVIWWLIHFLYTYIVGIFNVAQWQGLWLLLDGFTGTDINSSWLCFIYGYSLLCALRCIKSAHGPPLCVLLDTDPQFYRHTTRFGTKPGLNISHILDSVFTIMVVQQLIVLYWRGTWLLLDYYVYPGDYRLSAVVTLVGSLSLQVLVCGLQPIFNFAYRHVSDGIQRILLETIIFSFANLVAMCHWRGVWMLLEIYVMPDSPNLSCALTQAVAMVVLSLMRCAHSVTSQGCDVDGDSTPDDGCLCPNKYVRYFVENRRQPNDTPADKANIHQNTV